MIHFFHNTFSLVFPVLHHIFLNSFWLPLSDCSSPIPFNFHSTTFYDYITCTQINKSCSWKNRAFIHRHDPFSVSYPQTLSYFSYLIHRHDTFHSLQRMKKLLPVHLSLYPQRHNNLKMLPLCLGLIHIKAVQKTVTLL